VLANRIVAAEPNEKQLRVFLPQSLGMLKGNRQRFHLNQYNFPPVLLVAIAPL
jgi:hypothetical protein